MRQLLDVPAPAKLNLFLHITGRRADGYHLLQSVFMLIDWCDTLHFDRRTGGVISREDIGGTGPALPDNDLVVRAARALQQATGCEWGAHIALEKRIPQEAGLGGGSSDAASCLLALNRLWGLELPLAQLMQIGLRLGADVPFFLGGDNAWVEGVGEQLTPIALPAADFIVLKPPTGASTPKIFSSPELKRDSFVSTMREFFASPCVYEFGRNDLQPVASDLCPEIKIGIEILRQQKISARMTGSGSAMFAKANQAVDKIAFPDGWIAKNCKNLFEHPLKQWRK
ncbi:4-(cytidine 5'-diphospho)-2-C-methyl-D-erythritol kinase [Malikia sp.]|uniref:4-(cytidine 5'-diphospho)-2-C-methyl-D-erythritol kinase n=1 Tax=Malikia sp. TaxID=2070706 RepID=UPI0026017A92|nr:4-(cytidine 5'-diphospho)-2-C-methyl-D-erythritol kinase [Malikia sp.]MDD2730127.1 4-(cytidine 5'-diphospho)-2-C-methyl-D-erythritol kinase [Malikia sp.]